MCFFKAPKAPAPPPLVIPPEAPKPPDTSVIDARAAQRAKQIRLRGIAGTYKSGPQGLTGSANLTGYSQLSGLK